jgi:tricorn protease
LPPDFSEYDLRYRNWVESNRQYVEEKSGGKVGYIYVPDTGGRGQRELFRQFYGQMNKDALIIDERWNGGGNIADRFIELLNRPIYLHLFERYEHDWRVPTLSHQGPKCMLINGEAGSGGDIFPYLFRKAGLGKLIGMRTWGGVIGIAKNPSLIDGARITVPFITFYETNGTLTMEGHGVDPDIEVIDDPALMVDGGDPQLDAAIKHMLDEIEKNPYVPAKRPPYPDRSGMGILEEQK